jgi:hypothetical protein
MQEKHVGTPVKAQDVKPLGTAKLEKLWTNKQWSYLACGHYRN